MAVRIPEEFIQEVRDHTDIVDVVSNYVQLKKSGKNLFGYCPFHEERTASFSVAEDKQIFHCFSCGRGGNVFSFIMEIDHLTFPEAVLKVADLSSISIPDNLKTNNNNDLGNSTQFNELQSLYEQAQTFYQHVLLRTTTGETALKYLQERQLSEDTIETYKIGFAPDGNNLLLSFFKEKNISEDLLRKSGLFSENDTGELFDRFRGRIMFPIRDQNGRVIAFSGRILEKNPDVAKYLNSPETLLFNKSKVLFNYDLTKRNVREQKQVVLFEGFMDVISAAQAGVTTGVASMGTSLTEAQIYMINRITGKLLICYDGDDAGQDATHRSITLLKDKKLDLGVVVLPDKMDPDEYIKAKGSEAFQKIVFQGSQTPIAFELNRLSRSFNLNNDREKLEFLDQALRQLANINSAVEVELYLKKLSDQLSISMESLQKQFATVKREERIKNPPADFGSTKTTQDFGQTTAEPKKINPKLEIAQQNLLYLSLRSEDVYNKVINRKNFAFIDDKYNKILGSWAELANSDSTIAEFIDHLSEDLKPIVSQLEIKEFPEDFTDEEVDDYIAVIENSSVVDDYEQVKQQLNEAAANKDEEKVLELTNRLIELKKNLLNHKDSM
ncbi:DNA primase [Lactobacillus sp. YT155]|uniref:DNA primase n=1 Tax=Lactobacillus sp. YT155 TaxID=3060955 RepID=UPI00265FB9DC|nr:DNA primase [Lactobacillus sp. YT155]MDO1605456.1 DNA primase [Lactobacillus sp. YT155]